MTREPDLFGEDDAIDERIRQLATDPRDIEYPSSVAARVLAKTRRRRLALRAGYTMAAALSLIAVGAHLFRLFETNQPDRQVADNGPGGRHEQVVLDDLAIVELDPEYLSSPPPVISLNLISDDQIAMFHCLDALEEELP